MAMMDDDDAECDVRWHFCSVEENFEFLWLGGQKIQEHPKCFGVAMQFHEGPE